jgi:hypothetical protein
MASYLGNVLIPATPWPNPQGLLPGGGSFTKIVDSKAAFQKLLRISRVKIPKAI